MTGTKPLCVKCQRKSTAKTLEKNEGLCPRCRSMVGLPPFDDNEAHLLVRRMRRAGMNNDRILSELRRTIQPPDARRIWAPAHEWHALDVIEYASRIWIGLVS